MKDKKTSDFWNDSAYSEYHQKSFFFWSCYSFLLLIKFSAFTSTVKGARIVWRKHRLVSKESDTITAHPLTLVSWQQAPVPSVSKTLLPFDCSKKSYLKYIIEIMDSLDVVKIRKWKSLCIFCTILTTLW